MQTPSNDPEDIGWWYLPIQIGLLVAGVGGALLHALPIGVHEEHQNWPVLDLVTIAWIGLAVASAFVPSIGEIKFGDFSITLRDKLKAVSSEVNTTIDNLANLAQNWSTSAVLLAHAMSAPEATLPEPKIKTYFDYVRDRMGEAYEIIARNPDERIRIAFWAYNDGDEKIEFVYGFPQMTPTKTTYERGEGMIGKAFVERRHFNEADVRVVPAYLPTRNGTDPPYLSVLCEPAYWDRDVIGIITVDRSNAGFFDGYAVDIAKGLGAQCALATVLYQRSKAPATLTN